MLLSELTCSDQNVQKLHRLAPRLVSAGSSQFPAKWWQCEGISKHLWQYFWMSCRVSSTCAICQSQRHSQTNYWYISIQYTKCQLITFYLSLVTWWNILGSKCRTLLWCYCVSVSWEINQNATFYFCGLTELLCLSQTWKLPLHGWGRQTHLPWQWRSLWNYANILQNMSGVYSSKMAHQHKGYFFNLTKSM